MVVAGVFIILAFCLRQKLKRYFVKAFHLVMVRVSCFLAVAVAAAAVDQYCQLYAFICSNFRMKIMTETIFIY